MACNSSGGKGNKGGGVATAKETTAITDAQKEAFINNATSFFSDGDSIPMEGIAPWQNFNAQSLGEVLYSKCDLSIWSKNGYNRAYLTKDTMNKYLDGGMDSRLVRQFEGSKAYFDLNNGKFTIASSAGGTATSAMNWVAKKVAKEVITHLVNIK